MKLIRRLTFTFDDVLILPLHSKVLPKDVCLSTSISSNIQLKIPMFSAAMDTVTNSSVAIKMAESGGIGVIHKNQSLEEQCNEVVKVKTHKSKYVDKMLCAAAVGVTNGLHRTKYLIEAGADIIILDSAHGHSQSIINLAKSIKAEFPNTILIAGNIVTKAAAKALNKVGVDGVKVGVGPGSICTTRSVAGVGKPQLSAIIDISKFCRRKGLFLIADGGIKTSGDIVKALAAGADAVMLGSLLASTDESPGETILHNGVKYKEYRGMGSLGAMNAGSSDRYFQNVNQKFVPEGVEGLLKSKGKTYDVLYQIIGGIKSGLGYTGSKDLPTLRKRARFVRISPTSIIESKPHSLATFKDAPNYEKGESI